MSKKHSRIAWSLVESAADSNPTSASEGRGFPDRETAAWQARTSSLVILELTTISTSEAPPSVWT